MFVINAWPIIEEYLRLHNHDLCCTLVRIALIGKELNSPIRR